jgi:hypothetical protein
MTGSAAAGAAAFSGWHPGRLAYLVFFGQGLPADADDLLAPAWGGAKALSRQAAIKSG